MLCADLVDIRFKEPTGRSKRVVANLEDISLSGACLQLDREIPLGTLVRISYPKGEFTGVVRYCVFREIGFFVGLQFEPGIKWSKDDFKPLHLLDPRSLSPKPATKSAGSGRGSRTS
jgi:hypothetical protein